MQKNERKLNKKFPILNLDVLVENDSWWVIWEYIFSGKLRQPDDIQRS